MPMTDQAIAAAAHTLLDHRNSGAALEALPDGERRIGYKLGATNQLARDMLQVGEPFYGVLFDSLTSGSPAGFAAASMRARVVEPEIALELGADLDPAAAPFDAAAIRAATRSLIPAIEIVDTAYRAWDKVGGLALIADNAAHGRWVIGEPTTDIDAVDPGTVAVSLTVNGTVEREGVGANVDGGAYGATAWLANTLAARGVGLKAGDRITTGSATQPFPAAVGQTIVADFAGLGRIEIRLT